jgi:hypothetical protein
MQLMKSIQSSDFDTEGFAELRGLLKG